MAINRCIFVTNWLAIVEDADVILTLLPKGFIREALRIINAECSVQVPGTIPENGWEDKVICWKAVECSPTLASNSKSPPTSTLPLLLDEKGPLSQPEDNIGTSCLESKAGEFPASPASNSEDVPLDG